MATAKRFWLVYYAQCRPGQQWIDANGVTDKDPGAFLAELIEQWPDNDNRVTFAVEIPAASYRRLKGQL